MPTPLLTRALSVAGLCGLLACAGGAARADTDLPLIGGGGGDAFHGGCPPDQNLGGFELRVGDYIDAIRPVCVISLGPQAIKMGPVQPPFFGGAGGGVRRLVCPPHKPIVIGVYVAGQGMHFVTVSTITLYCGQAIGAQTPEESASYRRPLQVQSRGSAFQDPTPVKLTQSKQVCPTGQVAIGVHGRSGDWLDAMGLMCDVPRITSASQGAGVPRLPGDRAIGQGAATVPAAPAPAKKLGRAVVAPPGASGAALNKAAVLAPPQSNPLAGGASLKQAVVPAPGAARSPLQKADPAALNAQPQASPTTLPAQAPSTLR